VTLDLPEPADAGIRTVRQLLVARERDYGDRVFLRFEDRDLTYAELHRRSNRIANALRSRGLRPGDRIAIWMRNRPEYLELLFAAAKAGFVAVTVNPALRAVDGQYLLEDSAARAVVVGPEVADSYAAVRDRLADVAIELFVDDGSLEALQSEGGDELPEDPGIEPSTPFGIIYTSGTTGLPKGVVLPHGAYVNTGRWYGEHVVKAGPDDVFFTCLPFHHCNAQIFTISVALVRRSSVAMVEKFSASRHWDQVRHYGATIFNFIGMMLVALSKQPPRPDDADNPATRAFGIPVPEELGAEFERRFGVALLEGYGATETGCGFLFNTMDERRLGWAGRVMPYAEVRVVDEQAQELPPGAVGRIAMRPKLPDIWMREYHNKPEATERAWSTGWLELDDYGLLDQDGWLSFRGRGLDWLRRRGENISAIEIEDTCDQHPDVEKAAVVGVPSELTESDVKLFVVWREGVSGDPAALRAWLGERLADYKLPRYIEAVEEMPTTATGKLAKFRLGTEPTGWDVDEHKERGAK
jgi:crotonobetaine/carnitine-CoA ligase